MAVVDRVAVKRGSTVCPLPQESVHSSTQFPHRGEMYVYYNNAV